MPRCIEEQRFILQEEVPGTVKSCDKVSEEERHLSTIDGTIRCVVCVCLCLSVCLSVCTQEIWTLKFHSKTLPLLYSVEQQEEFKIWEQYDDTEDNFCELDGMCSMV